MSKEETKKEGYNVRVSLEGEMATKFTVVKKFYGLRKNADLLRLLITLSYERIIKTNNSRNNYTEEKPKVH